MKNNEKMNSGQEFILDEKIRQVAYEKRITLKKVAEIMGMTTQNLIRVMKVNSIQSKSLEKLCIELDVPISYFTNEHDNQYTTSLAKNTHDELERELSELKKKIEAIKILVS